MKNKHKVFYEILTITDYINLVISNRYAFFNVKSFSLRFVENIFKIDVYSRSRRIRFGDLNMGTGIRRHAYEAAMADLKKLGGICFDNGFRSLEKLNSNLIFEKLYFTWLYEKHEFYAMASQFSVENDQVEFQMHIETLPFGVGKFRFDKKIEVISSSPLKNKIAFAGSLIASCIVILPSYLLCLWLKNKSRNSPHFKNAIVCEVDGLSTYNMFRDILELHDNVNYVVSGHYVNNFTKEEIKKYGLNVTRLSKSGLHNIRNLPIEYLIFGIKNFNAISGFGCLFLDLVKMIAQGNLITVDAENSTYITFEHLFPAKTVRNELLRVKKNRSVFVCKNLYLVSRYFHFEFRYNYDILCSSGPCLESVYAMQKAETRIFLPTGAYDSHKCLVESDGLHERVGRLKSFIGDSVAITILSTGVMDYTYSEEVGLMQLARRLSAEPNVKVIIRQKPTQVEAKYSNFYIDNIGSCESILLTHVEYQLFDFLGITDLFITANSSAASDLCPAGAQFFSVDFLADNDNFLWQTLVEGVYIKEDEAFDTIMSWINDSPSGQRLAHQKRMRALSKLLAYQFDDFEVYKQNFLNLLNPYLPNARTDSIH